MNGFDIREMERNGWKYQSEKIMKDQKIIERLQEIHDRIGTLRPNDVIEDARDTESPLHKYFEWDAKKAHQKYLIIQARDLIRSVELVITEEKHQYSVIGYIRNPEADGDEQGYSSTQELRFKKDLARKALLNELRRAESALQRAYDVSEALGLRGEVEGLLVKLRKTLSAA